MRFTTIIERTGVTDTPFIIFLIHRSEGVFRFQEGLVSVKFRLAAIGNGVHYLIKSVGVRQEIKRITQNLAFRSIPVLQTYFVGSSTV